MVVVVVLVVVVIVVKKLTSGPETCCHVEPVLTGVYPQCLTWSPCWRREGGVSWPTSCTGSVIR